MTKRQANIYKSIRDGIEDGNNNYTKANVIVALTEMYKGNYSTIKELARAYQLITMYEAEYGNDELMKLQNQVVARCNI